MKNVSVIIFWGERPLTYPSGTEKAFGEEKLESKTRNTDHIQARQLVEAVFCFLFFFLVQGATLASRQRHLASCR